MPFIADLALREQQIQQNYRPVIAVHKWCGGPCSGSITYAEILTTHTASFAWGYGNNRPQVN